jgi:hypothetical protein
MDQHIIAPYNDFILNVILSKWSWPVEQANVYPCLSREVGRECSV